MKTKGAVVFEVAWNACINCGACVAVCPQEAGFISNFDTIAVNTPCDIACMFCQTVCPVSAISHQPITAINGNGFEKNETLYPMKHMDSLSQVGSETASDYQD